MIYLDANVIIRFVEGIPATADPIRKRLATESIVATSQLSRLECRCHPMRTKNAVVLRLFDTFFASHELQLVNITTDVIEEATKIRAEYGFKTPDALHLATAIISGSTKFLSGDQQLKRCKWIDVEEI